MVKTDNLGLNLYEKGDSFRILGTGGLNESLQTIDEKVSENKKAIEELGETVATDVKDITENLGGLKFGVTGDGILTVTYDDGL